MGSDRARISYEPAQQYRAVVAQQGRVTLEADWNESQQIASEELREETLDFVGSSGTPDNGYEVIDYKVIDLKKPSGSFDFATRNGTMYVGGVRAFTDNPIQYSNQMDWLDRVCDPDWVDLANAHSPRELVYLLLREQEVSAVEDSALLEKALGGPDTTQRLRLIQHIVRLQTKGENCSSALDEASKIWREEKGLQLDPSTLRLMSAATLQVSFDQAQTSTDLCEPEARSGYLGADNQLIRVQIIGFDPDTNQGKLVWGCDNAAFLYRVEYVDAQTLKLKSRPVDEFHCPRTNQAVEVLRSAAQLHNNEYIAAATGLVTTLTANYDPDTRVVSLADCLPLVYQTQTQTPSLFLRVWEKTEDFTPGNPVKLGGTGLQVTLSTNNQPWHIGDYWQIAVRPGEPTEVYPHRYLKDPQPPDGPRLWVCPLAAIEWNSDGCIKDIEDCRHHFDNLVDLTRRNLGGCCTVTVRPEDFTQGKTLQAILERYKNQEQLTICLLPGDYFLDAPLQLESEHSNLTLEGCHDGAVFYANPHSAKNFLHGMIVLNRANNVTLRRLRFQLPLVPFIDSGGQLAGLPTKIANRYVGELLQQQLSVSVGIRSLHCALLVVEDCLFRFTTGEKSNVFGVGILANSECHGLTVVRTRFVHDDEYLRKFGEFPYRLLVGFLLAPTVRIEKFDPEEPTGIVVPSLLQDATFRDNLFSGMTIAMLTIADYGVVRLENNTVRDCYGGLWLFSFDFMGYLFSKIPNSFIPILGGDAFLMGTILGQGFPLPKEFDTSDALRVESNQVREVKRVRTANLNTEFIAALNDVQPAAAVVGRALSSNFDELLRIFSIMEELALQQVQSPHRFSLSFHVLNNNIDTRVKEGASSTGLILIGNIRENGAEEITDALLLSANKICNRAMIPIPTALVLFFGYGTVTGNLILNTNIESVQEAHRHSLSLLYMNLLLQFGSLITGSAITGNVFQGTPTLPQLQGVPNWELLNTVIL